MTSYFSYSKTD